MVTSNVIFDWRFEPPRRDSFRIVPHWKLSQGSAHHPNHVGHESLDVTLSYLKGKDAESEEA
jgi:hypothetical protein